MCPTTIPTQSSKDSTHTTQRTESVVFLLPEKTSSALATILVSPYLDRHVSVYWLGADWTGDELREALMEHAADRRKLEDVTVVSLLGDSTGIIETLGRAAKDLCRSAGTQPGSKIAKDAYTLKFVD